MQPSEDDVQTYHPNSLLTEHAISDIPSFEWKSNAFSGGRRTEKYYRKSGEFYTRGVTRTGFRQKDQVLPFKNQWIRAAIANRGGRT